MVKGFEDVGGMVGMLNNSDILNSYNNGTVSGSKSVGHFLRTVHTCYPFLFSAPAFALV